MIDNCSFISEHGSLFCRPLEGATKLKESLISEE